MKTKHPVHIMTFRVVARDGDLDSSFPNGLKLNTESYINYFEEVELTWIERVVARGSKFGNRNLRHPTEVRELSVNSEKISAATSPLKSVRLTSHIAIPLIIIYGKRLSQGMKKKSSVLCQWGARRNENDSIR